MPVREVFNPEATLIHGHLQKCRDGHPRDEFDCLCGIAVELFRGASMFVLELPREGIVAFTTIHIGRRKKNVWEPYANWTLAYTTPAHRRRGHMGVLARHTLEHARFLGCARVKSKVGSYLGLRLHCSLGHDIWGIVDSDAHELQVDAHLIPRDSFPDGRTPMGARACNTRGYPLTRDELASIARARGWDARFLALAGESSSGPRSIVCAL